jgi:hypothetical protein
MSQPEYAHNLFKTDVTILSGAAVSGAVDLAGARLVGFLTPATLTNTAFDVQASFDRGTTWVDVSSMSAISAPVSTLCAISPADSACASYVRLQGSGNEGADRTITLIYMKVA